MLSGPAPSWSPSSSSYPLVWVDVSHNLLNGSLSRWMTSLSYDNASSMIYMDVSYNGFTGCLPVPWGDIYTQGLRYDVYSRSVRGLKSLRLSSNPLLCPIMDILGSVLSLQSLLSLDIINVSTHGHISPDYLVYYDDRGVKGVSIAYLESGLTNLISVNMRANPLLLGPLPVSLPRLLTYMDVSSTGLNGPIPSTPSYASLSSLMAMDTSLNSTSMGYAYAYAYRYPYFMTVANSSASDWGYASSVNMWCPNPRGAEAYNPSMIIALDYGYDGYSSCVCAAGYQSSSAVIANNGAHVSSSPSYTNSTPLCVPCGVDAYRPLSFNSSHISSNVLCVSCPQYSTTPSSSTSSSIDSCQCDAGRYHPLLINTSSSPDYCAQCAIGKYKFLVSNDPLMCLNCSSGSYGTMYGSVSSSSCTPCPPGTYNDRSGSMSDQSCVRCPIGRYSSSYGVYSWSLCSGCPAGTYGVSTNASSSHTSSTSSLPTSVSSGCQPCPTNTYSTIIGAMNSSVCVSCPNHYKASIDGCVRSYDNNRVLLIGACVSVGVVILMVVCTMGMTRLMYAASTRVLLGLIRVLTGRYARLVWYLFDVVKDGAAFAGLYHIYMTHEGSSVDGPLLVAYFISISVGGCLSLFMALVAFLSIKQVASSAVSVSPIHPSSTHTTPIPPSMQSTLSSTHQPYVLTKSMVSMVLLVVKGVPLAIMNTYLVSKSGFGRSSTWDHWVVLVSMCTTFISIGYTHHNVHTIERIIKGNAASTIGQELHGMRRRLSSMVPFPHVPVSGNP